MNRFNLQVYSILIAMLKIENTVSTNQTLDILIINNQILKSKHKRIQNEILSKHDQIAKII